MTIRTIAILAILAILIGLPAATVRAINFDNSSRIHISNLHRIDDDLYAFAEELTIDGEVDGEVTAFVYDTRISGIITGTVSIFSYQVRHTGQIGRSLRAFANTITIDGSVGRSALIMGSDVAIGRSAVIERDCRLYGASIHMDGTINGPETTIEGDKISVDGFVRGNLTIKGKTIRIGPSAVIDGDLIYSCLTEDDITIEEGATINGERTWTPPKEKDEDDGSGFVTGVVVSISKLLAAFLFGILILLIFRRYAEESFKQVRSRFTVSLAAGFLSLLVLAFVVLALAVAIVLLISGMVLTGGDSPILGAVLLVVAIVMVPITTFGTVVGGIMLYSGKIVVGFLLGAFLLKRIDSRPLNKINLLVGLVLLSIVFAVPYVGSLLYVLVSITGAGAILLGIKHCPRAGEDSQTPPTTSGSDRNPPPVIPPQ